MDKAIEKTIDIDKIIMIYQKNNSSFNELSQAIFGFLNPASF